MRRRFICKLGFPSNEIWYTTNDSSTIEIYEIISEGANIISNSYTNGKGVIVFDKAITSIDFKAFYYCLTLVTITIPEGVTSIGANAFYNCTSLASITIPDSVTEIGNGAFNGCTSLTSITIPDSVTKIRNSAFYNCTSLTNVTIGNGVTSIEQYAFNGCTSLASITIPDSVTSIGYQAFYYCLTLVTITIPDSVTSIGILAFYNCSSLKSVYCKPTTPPNGGYDMFSNNALGRTIYVPTESVEAYKTAEYWSDYATDIVGYDFENDTVVGGGNEIEFPVTLVAGDNGELGVKLYNYLIAVLPENTTVSCPNDEYGIGEIIIQGWGNAEWIRITGFGNQVLTINMANSKMDEEGFTPSLQSNGFFS